MRYYIAENGNPAGPFEPAELLQHGLTVNSLVWCDGMANWALASQVPELMALLANQTITNPGGFGTAPTNVNVPFPPVSNPQPTQQMPQGYPTNQPANQPPVTNQPWNQPQYAPDPQPQPQQMPKTWLAEAIIVTLVSCLCCTTNLLLGIIPGIIAIVNGTGVKSRFNKGDYAGAQKKSSSARLWVIITLVIAVISAGVFAYNYVTNPELLQQIQEGTFGDAFFGVWR